jgi:hypothetical protein
MRTQMILIGALVAACTDTPVYYYAPEQAAVRRAGMPTRIEKIPPEAPQGTIAISSQGLTRGQRGELALHVRLVVSNEGDDQPWSVDVREQMVEVANVGRSQPQFANAGIQSLPTLSVARREQRVLDLYYPVPPGVEEADDLPGFDVLWQVDTGARAISGRAHIMRREVVDPPSTTIYASGWGPYWWYDPWYPRVVYRPIYIRPHVHRDHRR